MKTTGGQSDALGGCEDAEDFSFIYHLIIFQKNV